MMRQEDFKLYVYKAMTEADMATLRSVVEKELLHYEIFNPLDKEDLLKNLVFQGGTSLRLCRGKVRFREDLDFAGGKDFPAKSMKIWINKGILIPNQLELDGERLLRK